MAVRFPDLPGASTAPVEFSLAYLTVFGATPLEQIAIAADAGYDFVGLRVTAVAPGERVTTFVGDPLMTERIAARLAETGVRVLDVELARLGPDESADDYLTLCEAAAAVGARHIVGQVQHRDHRRGLDQFCRLCELAGEFGLTVELEFPSWMEVGDLGAAAEIVGDCGRPNAGILVDALHFYRSGARPEDLDPLPREWFRCVQLCDGPAASPASVDDVIHAARAGRSLLGYGELDVRALLAHLPVVPYSLEVPNNVLREELGTADYARLVLATARAFVADAGLLAVNR
jgi:sugar phosphate isomerase/epimerase